MTRSRSATSGIYLLKTSLLASLPAGIPLSIERDLFPSLIGQSFYGFPVSGPFLDIGLPETYAQAADFFAVV